MDVYSCTVASLPASTGGTHHIELKALGLTTRLHTRVSNRAVFAFPITGFFGSAGVDCLVVGNENELAVIVLRSPVAGLQVMVTSDSGEQRIIPAADDVSVLSYSGIHEDIAALTNFAVGVANG